MSPLGEQIVSELPWLCRDLGFTMTYDSYEPKSFGDCLVILASERLRLRLVKDRGQILMDVATPAQPEAWHNLFFVLEALGREVTPAFDLGTVGSLLKGNYDEILVALGPKLTETERELARLTQERMARLRMGK